MHSSRLIRKNTLSAAIAAALLATGQSTMLMAQNQAEEAEDSVLMEEVIVTATRRESTIVEIPYNISAVTGDFIDSGKIMTTGELLRGVPGANVIDFGARNSGNVNAIRIRGLAIDSSINMDVALSAVPPVSTYINETPVYANLVLKDLERVEVLRGPQGTLYGSGSLGGTVRYITRRPVLDSFEGRVEGSVSSNRGLQRHQLGRRRRCEHPDGRNLCRTPPRRSPGLRRHFRPAERVCPGRTGLSGGSGRNPRGDCRI